MYSKRTARAVRELELALDLPQGSHWGDGGTGHPDERELWQRAERLPPRPVPPEEVSVYMHWDTEQRRLVGTTVCGSYCFIELDEQTGRYKQGRQVIPSWCKPEDV